MKPRSIWITAFLGAASASVMAAPFLPLPSWEGSAPTLEAGLWPSSPIPTLPPGTELVETDDLPPAEPGLPKDDDVVYEMRRPLEVFEGDAVLPSERLLEKTAIRAAHLPDYFANPPQGHLVNPQHLLSEPQQEDVARFLEYHASESEIDIYTLVFDVGQEASGGANLDNFAANWFPDENAVVIAYFLGNPGATQLGASPKIRSRFEPERLEKLRTEAVTESLQVADHVAQLDRFCLKTSLLLFWLERDDRERLARLEEERVESAAIAAEVERRNSPTGRLIARSPYLLGGAGTLLIGGFVTRGLVRRRRESKAGEILYFGSLGSAQRLGAPYSGGSSARVRFK